MDDGIKIIEQVRGVLGERGSLYGPPDENFSRIALFWSVYLSKKLRQETTISPKEVAVMMTLLKVARMVETPDHFDDFLDAVGYLVLGVDLGDV